MAFSVQNLCGFLMRSKLMAPDVVQTMQQRWQAEARDQAGDTTQFVKWLVAKKYLTEYQANLIAKGHADDFFLNEYMILERLGRGRMAGVYKAAHPLGQVVAIKVLPPSKAKSAHTLGRFQREATLALKLKHANVVRTFQVGKSGDINYLVMEYLEGETLDDVLQRRKKLPPSEAVRVIHQALAGLQHIGDQGMVHRDLKPANLMLVPAAADGEPDTTLHSTVKILDIGLARQLFDEGQTPPEIVKSELTAEGVLLGTPDYLAPEQARDPRNIDIRADIYSLGCVLYHTLTGQPPFPDTNILSQMVRHATETPKPLKDFNPQIPDGLQQIVNWMIAKQPAERYPSPERAAQALQMFLLADNVPAKPLDDAPQMRKYLTWLEKGDAKEESTLNLPPGVLTVPTSKPPSSASIPATASSPAPAKPPSNPLAAPAKMPASPTAAAAAPAESCGKAPSHRKEKKHKRHHHRDKGKAPIPTVPAVPIAAPAEFDVELVAAEEPPLIMTSLRPTNKRDWILLGIGAAATLFLAFAIFVFVVVIRGFANLSD
jgi:eukaryotic-like serine/threonine-protein kinase